MAYRHHRDKKNKYNEIKISPMHRVKRCAVRRNLSETEYEIKSAN